MTIIEPLAPPAKAVGAQAASLTRAYSFSPVGFSHVASGAVLEIATPYNLMLFQAHRLVTNTTNLQAGDDWGAPQYLVEEWIEE